MIKKNRVQVVVGGKILTMSGSADELTIQKVASCVNKKLEELENTDAYRALTADFKALLVYLNLAEDLVNEQERCEQIQGDLQVLENELSLARQELVEARIQAENEAADASGKWQAQLAERDETIEELRASISALEEAGNQSRSDAQAGNEALLQTQLVLQEKEAEYADEKERLEKRVSDLRRDLKAKDRQLTEDKRRLNGTIENLRGQLSEAQAALDKKEAQLDAELHAADAAHAEQLRIRTQDLASRVQELEERLRTRSEELQAKVREEGRQLLKASESEANLKKENESLRTAVGELEKRLAQSAAGQKETAALREELSEAKEMWESAEESLTLLEETLQARNEELAEEKQRADRLTSEYEQKLEEAAAGWHAKERELQQRLDEMTRIYEELTGESAQQGTSGGDVSLGQEGGQPGA